MNTATTSRFEDLYPSLLKRFQSASIDGILLLFLMLGFYQLCDALAVPIWLRVVFMAFLLLYEPLCMTFGCTLGNYVVGIRVRRDGDYGRRIHFGQAVLRYLFKLLLGWLSFLTVHANLRKRAMHDMMTGTVMIRAGVVRVAAG